MIIAKVNNYKIFREEYELELRTTMSQMKLEQVNYNAQKAAINRLIDGYLLLDSARKSGVQVNDSEIDKRFVEISLEFSSRRDFDEALKHKNLTEEMLREQILNELIVKKFVNRFYDEEDVDESKLRQIYQENIESFRTQEMVKASHILVKNDEDDHKTKIKEIRARIKNPKDFNNEAIECSQCPSCCNFGDLGYFSRGKMVKAFEEVAFNMEVGEISEPIETKFGSHIIMITDKKPSKIAKFEEVKDSLKKRVKEIERDLSVIRHIKQLKVKADIEIYEDRL
jgi:peptidyl-prolyl cis-trans isomerase C